MKYNIETKSIGEYILKYTNVKGEEVSRNFKMDIESASELDRVNLYGRVKLNKYLSENGWTKNDFILVKKDGKGNTIYDESNYLDLEKAFIDDASMEVTIKIFKKCMGISITELLLDMVKNPNENDIKLQNEISKFTEEILSLMTGIKKDDTTPFQAEKKL